MINQITCPTSLHLCSRCAHTEITGWINDRWQNIDPEVKNLIIQELRMVKLTQGDCIVCKNPFVTSGMIEKVFRIMQENKVSEQILIDFAKDFCLPKNLKANF